MAPFVEVVGQLFEVDGNGFFKSSTGWTEEVGRGLAKGAGLHLDDEHWRVLRFLRGHYETTGKAPRLRELCLATGFKIKKIYMLFPNGLSEACRLGGLPRPRCG
jgi:tRNA 2-thiouridine synthesizing protein E